MSFNLELAFGSVCGDLTLINWLHRKKADSFLSMDFRKFKFFPSRTLQFSKSPDYGAGHHKIDILFSWKVCLHTQTKCYLSLQENVGPRGSARVICCWNWIDKNITIELWSEHSFRKPDLILLEKQHLPALNLLQRFRAYSHQPPLNP